MPATPAWLAGIEALLNRGIDASFQAQQLAARLNDTAVRVDIDGFAAVRARVSGGRLALIVDGAAVSGHDAASVNASITGSPLALIHLARGGAGRGAAANRDAGRAAPGRARPRQAAQVRGDAEIADAYRRLLALARPDFEDELSRWVGDLPARRFAQLLRHSVAWMQKTRRTAGENIAEYLQEESRDLVNRTELDEFLKGVDELRETADRIEARLARLEPRIKGSP